MLQIRNLTKRFGGFHAVNNVSFDVSKGEILGLIGPNGSGKSTTFNMIAGLLPPTSGTIHFEGKPIHGQKAHAICHRGIGRTFQIPRPFNTISLVENVSLAAWFGQNGRQSRESCLRQACETLELVGLPTHPAETTNGMGAAGLKKLELARALASNPKLLLADESLNGLDESEMDQAADMLKRIREERGVTIIWVEHIMGVLMRVVDRVVVLNQGEKIYDGQPLLAQTDPKVVQVYLNDDLEEVDA
ncbi:ABC transporter ATP-binding protein [Castellaniella defragrans]|uniref:ABC transporter ATP-binding protein n=1 Tax=Castellaniella defragrans TaxID=75697 RepID=UPI0023F36291|nr:ABC transporter ATP-binding protein [Castellaniella defragrans]